MSIEAMKRAVDALRDYYKSDDDRLSVAMSILVAAIEQAEKKEPVGYFSVNDYGNWEQNESNYGTPLYTAPRQWVGLTDEEIEYLDMETSGTVHDFVRAIEAKLREKNR